METHKIYGLEIKKFSFLHDKIADWFTSETIEEANLELTLVALLAFAEASEEEHVDWAVFDDACDRLEKEIKELELIAVGENDYPRTFILGAFKTDQVGENGIVRWDNLTVNQDAESAEQEAINHQLAGPGEFGWLAYNSS